MGWIFWHDLSWLLYREILRVLINDIIHVAVIVSLNVWKSEVEDDG